MNEADSLDPVASWETLARLCSADMWDGDSLHPIALQIDDLKESDRGWSVQRAECTDLDLALQTARRLRLDPNTATVAIAVASDVRKITTEADEQGLFVLENFISDNHAHALVFARQDMKRGGLRRIRGLLTDLLVRKNRLQEVFR